MSALLLDRLDVTRYLKMIDAGVFPDDVRVELLDGILVEKMTKNDPHDFSVFVLAEALRALNITGRLVREEKSVVLGAFWRPEPDIAVVRGPRARYGAAAPRPEDIDLLIEVAESSHAKDRGIKWAGYAAAMIPEYWIVNLAESRVEVYADPDGSGDSAAYRGAASSGRDDRVPVVIGGEEVGRLLVAEILPRIDDLTAATENTPDTP